jgi:hypothetical protein
VDRNVAASMLYRNGAGKPARQPKCLPNRFAMNRSISLLASLICLSACGNGSGSNASAGNSVSPAPEMPFPDETERPNRGRIHLAASTRAGVEVQIHPSIAASLGLPAAASNALGTSVVEGVGRRLRQANMDSAIFYLGSPMPDKADNILIRLSVRPGEGPRSYGMRLTATQGEAFWSASLARPSGARPDHVGIADEQGRPTGHPEYESMMIDAGSLARQLADVMGIRETRQ